MDVFSLVMRLKEEGAAQVKASVDKLNRSFDESSRKATAMDEAIAGLKDSFRDLATIAAAGTFFKKIIDETSAAQFAQAQLQSALKSTGNTAGQTVANLNAMAGALQDTTVFADDAVTAAQSLLLTFDQIGRDTFPRATKAIADLAQAKGMDLVSATQAVGKALNSPIDGLSALGRITGQFTEQEKNLITTMVNTNRVADAQALILGKLETKFGGSAEAAGKTLGGAIARLGNAFGDLFEISESASEGIVGAIEFIIDKLKGLNTILTNVRQAIQLFGLNAGVMFQEIKAFLTMSGDEYRGYMKILKQYEDEQENIILGLTQETVAQTKAAAAIGGTTEKVKTYLELLTEWAGLGSITIAQQNDLITAQDALTARLIDGNLPLQKQIELKKQLLAITDALNTATVTYGDEGFRAFQKALGQTGAEAVGTTTAVAPFKVAPVAISPAVIAQVRQNAAASAEVMRSAIGDELTAMAGDLQQSITQTIGDALVNGIEAAIQRGANIGDAFKAFGVSLLAGLGSVMIAFGQRLTQIGVGLVAAMKAFKTGNGPAMIAAGIAFMALGAALRGAAGRAMDQTGFGGGGGGFTAPAVGGAMSGSLGLPTQFYGPTAAGSASTIERVNPVNVTIIGPNDPAAQRQMQELVRNAQRRGSV